MREYKSVLYGGGKEQELTHGGKVMMTKVGNYGGNVGTSGSEDAVGKKICVGGLAEFETDAENGNPKFSKFSKIQSKYVATKQTKSSNRLQEIYQLEGRISEWVKWKCFKLYDNSDKNFTMRPRPTVAMSSSPLLSRPRLRARRSRQGTRGLVLQR